MECNTIGAGMDVDEELGSLVFDEWNDTTDKDPGKDRGDDVGNRSSLNHNNSSLFNNTTSNVSYSSTSNRLDISALCRDEELSGFDKNAGPTWIYPTNYPVRDYQFNIISSSLFKNTLVSLPTGLGKTFIAAVLMYNFYRWYPMSKIVFTAPTRPLVAQQIEACYNITAIPQQDTVEMTGTMQANARKIAWKQKRVFFATPQVVNNDLESGICPGELIRCLVIDEAHRAKGKHAYCQLMEQLTAKGHTLLRILALSATPGSKVDDVISVVKSLHIAHLELRSEQCIDVAMYSHSRKMDTIVVQLGDELTNVRKQYLEIMDRYTRRLVQYRILASNISALSKGKIIMLFKEYQLKDKSQRHPQHQRIMQDFTMVITLYHALELLTKHGARVFLNFFDERTDKHWVGKDDNLTCFLERLRDDLGVNPFTINRNTLPDGTVPEIKEELKFGHPKFDHLKRVMLEHFQQAEKRGLKTKAIVFCEYRESVHLVQCLLLQCRPLIRPHIFIGQGAGSSSNSAKDPNMKAFSQKQQLRVMKMFKEDKCNVLVSTCIGEEGLDVGSVDLIICFDISNKSPIRLVQRCGRTGREREGRVVILVTEGREHQTLRDCIVQKDSLNRRVLQSKELVKNLYSSSPRMIPRNLNPKCQKMHFTIQKPKQEEKANKVQGKIKDMFKKTGAGSMDNEPGPSHANLQITDEDITSMFPNGFPSSSHFVDSVEYWNKNKDFLKADPSMEGLPKILILSEWLEWQRTLQFTANVEHSVDSEILSHILKLADSKRFETQNEFLPASPELEVFITESKSPIKPANKITHKTKNKPAANDIRTMFQKMHKPTEEEVEKSLFDKKLKEILEECGIWGKSESDRKDILEKERITTAMIDLMVEINLELLKVENQKPSKYEPHRSIRKINAENNAVNLSSYLKIPSDKFDDLHENINNINVEDFERLLKLDDDEHVGDKVNSVFPGEINFCDDSLFIMNDAEFVFDNSLPEVRYNKSFKCAKEKPNNENNKSDEEIVDHDISKTVMNDDFDIGNIDDIFEDTDDNFNDVNNKTNVSEKDKNDEVIFDGNETVDYELTDKVVFENDFDFGDIDDIFDNTEDDAPKEINNGSVVIMDQVKVQSKPVTKLNTSNDESNEIIVKEDVATNPLTFFGLDDIDDLFANDDFEENDNKNDKEDKNNDLEDLIIDPPDSPILLSQRTDSFKSKKLHLNNHVTSTPIMCKTSRQQPNKISNLLDEPFEDISILSNNFYYKSVREKSKSIVQLANNNNDSTVLNKTNTTSFTITQIINLVNKENNKTVNKSIKNHTMTDFIHKEDREGNKSIKNDTMKDNLYEENGNSSDESNHSLILSSQMPKPIKKLTDSTSQKMSVTILETSESSGDDLEIIDTNRAKFETKGEPQKIGSSSTTKRKVISSDEEFEPSPFFKRSVTETTPKRNVKKLSLREKISNTMNGMMKMGQSQTVMSPTKNYSERKDTNKENTRITKEFKCPVSFQSQLSQFCKPKLSQWTTDCSQVNRDRNMVSSTSKPTVISSDEDDFEQKTPTKMRRIIKKKERRKNRCEFIDYEAELSDDSYEDSGDDEHSQHEGDTSLHRFICDEDLTDHHQNNGIDMEAKYLQSVKSPVKSHGQFKIPMMQQKKANLAIFSQVDPDENDSFCVDDDVLSQRNEMCELELAEEILKKRKRRRKKAPQRSPSPVRVNVPCTTNPADDSPIGANRKKRVYQQINSESSTDDELFL